ncbi:alpha/beta hydrolase fold containing protein [Nitrosomonas sp. Is79A3]|uniref:alpha/beta fold hydrolase n=1 Tax=Nitrosomonas sp. (strain Is79A3) TaxID=261292 RepID=UPI000215D1B9
MKTTIALCFGVFALLMGCTTADTAQESKGEKSVQSLNNSIEAKTLPANKYNLITEDIFDKAYQSEIVKYWDGYGKNGNFSGIDGVEIKYKTFIRNDEKGAIVISSGRTEGYIKYQELVYDLGKQGYSIYIMDHRGQGFSGRMTQNKQMGHVKKFDDYVEDLKYFVDNVVKQIPHKNIFLLGHSMGGGIATLYIEKYPDDFKAAALSSPMHEPGDRLLFINEGCGAVRATRWWRENVFGISEPRYVALKGDYSRPACTGSEDDLTHSIVRCTKVADLYENKNFHDVKLGGPSTHWAAEACEIAVELRSKKETNKIKIPVLVLQAGDDKAVNSDGQNEFCNNLQSNPNKRRCFGDKPQIIPGAYHELFIEKDEFRIPALTKILDFFVENH